MRTREVSPATIFDRIVGLRELAAKGDAMSQFEWHRYRTLEHLLGRGADEAGARRRARADRRLFPRVTLALWGTIETFAGEELGLTLLTDVGAGGLCLAGGPSLAPGLRVRVRVRVDVAATKRSYELPGVIAWRDGPETGLAFDGIPRRTQLVITRREAA